VIIVELRNRKIWDAIKAFVDKDLKCEIVKKDKKIVGFDTVLKITTMECNGVTLKFEEGLGIFDALISVNDTDVVYFRYWPDYGVMATIAMYKKGEKWEDLITITKDDFDKVFLAYDIVEALARKIPIKQIYDKVEEIERKYVEELWPRQKLVYMAWVSHAMEKLGMTGEIQKTA